jgi:RNA polymerase sigma factor (TIGR02999 family)
MFVSLLSLEAKNSRENVKGAKKASNEAFLLTPRGSSGSFSNGGRGDEGALKRLIPLVHQELHRIAERCMAGARAGHSLQATVLVNEAYLQLVDAKDVAWHDRAHFLAVAARAMRRILVEHARAHRARKRGGGAPSR